MNANANRLSLISPYMTLTTNPNGTRLATLVPQARTEVERMTLEGYLGAGEKLKELAPSDVMGVSRGAVRQAILSPADGGLIGRSANCGAVAHQTRQAEMRNRHDPRSAVFCDGPRLCRALRGTLASPQALRAT